MVTVDVFECCVPRSIFNLTATLWGRCILSLVLRIRKVRFRKGKEYKAFTTNECTWACDSTTIVKHHSSYYCRSWRQGRGTFKTEQKQGQYGDHVVGLGMINHSSPQVGQYNMTLFIILMLLLLTLIYGLSLGFQSRSTRFLFESYNRNGLCLCLFLARVITSAIRTDSCGVIPRSHYNLYHNNMVQYWNFNGSYILWNMKVINCNALTSAF